MKKYKVYLSIGSNIGNKKENCNNGLNKIETSGAGIVTAVSRFYQTKPVDYTDQDWFVNIAAEIETVFMPEALLTELKRIERELGTINKEVRFGPRIIDLDILLYGDRVINSGKLIIPHERMHERVFVLRPLCDIDSALIHPVLNRSVEQLLIAIDDENQNIILME